MTTKRPISIMIIAAVFLIAGAVGLAYHITELNSPTHSQPELILVLFIRLLAIIGAIFLFRGANWARWFLACWMAYHIILSLFHSVSQLLVHVLLFGTITFFLFRRSTSIYFTTQNTLPTTRPAKS